ncbi:MAG: hypothetical protein ACLPKE_33410, partial [Streptosporangiaceae bacterium]
MLAATSAAPGWMTPGGYDDVVAGVVGGVVVAGVVVAGVVAGAVVDGVVVAGAVVDGVVVGAVVAAGVDDDPDVTLTLSKVAVFSALALCAQVNRPIVTGSVSETVAVPAVVQVVPSV